MIIIEIIFKIPENIIFYSLKIKENTNIPELLFLCKSLNLPLPEGNNTIFGIFGKKINSEYILQNLDRLEFYSAMLKTPNEQRLLRQKQFKLK